jgi:predicted nucleic-acid-binding Zn-ribbon protein
MENLTPCPNCQGSTLYESRPISSGGGYAPLYLPGLGPWYRTARFVVVVCRDCGLTRFFAQPEARRRLKESSRWKPVSPSDRGGMVR